MWRIAGALFFVLAELLIAPLGLALLQRSAPLVLLESPRASGTGKRLGYLAPGEVGTLWSGWPTRNVLAIPNCIPVGGAAHLSWHHSETFTCSETTAP